MYLSFPEKVVVMSHMNDFFLALFALICFASSILLFFLINFFFKEKKNQVFKGFDRYQAPYIFGF